MEVDVKLDRVTVTGKVVDRVDLLTRARRLGWVVKERQGQEYAVIEREYDNGDTENKAVLMPNPFQEDSWRIDTSNHLTEYEMRQVIGASKFLAGRHLTRIDVAFDFVNGDYKPMKHAIIRPRATQTEIRDISECTSIFSGSGELETMYSGKRSSDVMIRMYNKLVEAKKHHQQIPDGCVSWERWELQLRGKKTGEWLKSAKEMLSMIKYPRFQDLNASDIAVLHAINDRIISFNDFAKEKAARLRKLQKSSVGYSDAYAQAGMQALEANTTNVEQQIKKFLSNFE